MKSDRERTLYMTEALREALREEMARDESVFLMGEDIGAYGGAFGVTMGLIDEFGNERVRDVPISEGSFMGAAVGAALMGMRPVVEIMFSDFVTLAMDQLINHAAKMFFTFGEKVPLVVRMPSGGGRGYGPTHSQSLEVLLASVSGLKVVVPSGPYAAKGLLKAVVRDDNPVVFVEYKRLYGLKEVVPRREYTLDMHRCRVLREGSDVTVASYGAVLQEVIEAAGLLEEEGTSVEVLDLVSLNPLDVEGLLQSVRRTGRLVVVEEASAPGGIGGNVAAAVFEEAYYELDGPVVILRGKNCPIPAAPSLERKVPPGVDDVVEAVRKTLEV